MEETQGWQGARQAGGRAGWSTSKAKLRARMYCMMLALDVLSIAFAFGLASAWRFGDSLAAPAWTLTILLIPVYVALAVVNQAYSVSLANNHWAAIGRSLKALVTAAAALIFFAFIAKAGAEISRFTFAAGVALSAGALAIERYLFAKHSRKLLGGDAYEVVIIRDDDQIRPIGPTDCVIFMSADNAFDPTKRTPAMYDRLARAIGQADRVIVQCSAARRQTWAAALRGANVQGEIQTPEMDDLEPLGLAQHGGSTTLIVTRGPLGLKDRLVKRAFDVAFASAALILFAPLMILVALAVRAQDGGPVFFRQTRIGRSNQLFQVLKFRSMFVRDCDSAGDRSTMRDDARITPVGRIIRATSIDELPQLLNVLRGDMSIVGPRPHALGSTAEDQLFWDIDERYWDRHAIKPGLTGLAQVRGFRGATRYRLDVVNRLHSDLEYLNGWTIWRDVVIVLRTAAVLFHRNAF